MIKLTDYEVVGFKHAIRGMRNPLNSWANSDSFIISEPLVEGFDYIGEKDLTLMKKLASAGTSHSKYRRMITVYVDIKAPLYWWKEFDTYKVGTVANSCSTMHKIHAKKFEVNDFSHEHLTKRALTKLLDQIDELNFWRDIYNDGGLAEDKFGFEKVYKPKDKKAWYQMIQLLPTSYNQKRTIMFNYEVLANMYKDRKNHKLDEWQEDFCEWIEELPFSEIIIGEKL